MPGRITADPANTNLAGMAGQWDSVVRTVDTQNAALDVDVINEWQGRVGTEQRADLEAYKQAEEQRKYWASRRGGLFNRNQEAVAKTKEFEALRDTKDQEAKLGYALHVMMTVVRQEVAAYKGDTTRRNMGKTEAQWRRQIEVARSMTGLASVLKDLQTEVTKQEAFVEQVSENVRTAKSYRPGMFANDANAKIMKSHIDQLESRFETVIDGEHRAETKLLAQGKERLLTMIRQELIRTNSTYRQHAQIVEPMERAQKAASEVLGKLNSAARTVDNAKIQLDRFVRCQELIDNPSLRDPTVTESQLIADRDQAQRNVQSYMRDVHEAMMKARDLGYELHDAAGDAGLSVSVPRIRADLDATTIDSSEFDNIELIRHKMRDARGDATDAASFIRDINDDVSRELRIIKESMSDLETRRMNQLMS